MFFLQALVAIIFAIARWRKKNLPTQSKKKKLFCRERKITDYFTAQPFTQ